MSRRDFLKQLAAAGAIGMTPEALLANASTTASISAVSASAESAAFKSSFNAIPESFGPTQVEFNNPVPDGLSGTLFRNGPALFQRGSTNYHHWFDGDGMIQSFQIDGRQLTHKASMVRTTRYMEEEKAGQFLWSGFGTSIKGGRSVTQADDANVANISVLPVQDELWALWEAGSAWEIDPDSLDTVGRKVLSSETDGLPFSAHPRVEADGRIWNFGYVSGADTLILYDIAANGELNRVQPINTPNTNMVHDFAVTDQHLIFVLLPITYNIADTDASLAFGDRLGWDNSAPVHVLVVNKSNLEIERRFEMPSFFAFHFGNAWQDGQQLRVELATSNPWDEFNTMVKQATQGIPLENNASAKKDNPTAMELVIDLQRKVVSVESIPIIGGDFPAFDNRYIGSRTKQLTMINRSSALSDSIFGANQLVQYDRSSQKTQQFDYGSDSIAEEHVFVPKAGAKEGIGWLVGTSYNWRKQLTSLSVFNNAAIEDGPVATAELPYNLPLGFHGKFVAS